MEKILLIGAGALACDIIEIFGASAFVAAYVDAPYARTDAVDGVPVCTDWRQAAQLATHYAMAVSAIDDRERFISRAAGAGLEPASPLVSPFARIARRAKLSRGCVIGHFVVVGPAVRLDPNCLVMHNVMIGHDSVMENNVVLCQSACLGGYVRIGARSFVGSNAVLAPKVGVGSDSFIAAGAACLRDAPANSQLIGNPAKRTTYSTA